MNHPTSRSASHAVYLVDLEAPLTHLLMVLADHCDEDKMFNRKDLLMLALNLLYVEDNVKEAIIAMEIEVKAYCGYSNTTCEYAQQRIQHAIVEFLYEMHRLFKVYRFYTPSSTLGYTFGGWHDEYVPVFVPYSHLQLYPQAISAVIGGEPADNHPSYVFRHPLDRSQNKPDEFQPPWET